tara:strand:- start:18039 stop:19253 length:1215 start_codon:yes stop_codon:yes gene_type:complete
MNKTNVKYLLMSQKEIDDINHLSLLSPFSDEIIEFGNYFSRKILTCIDANKFPELAVLGFWLRKSNLQSIKKHFYQNNKHKIIVPRGLVFHIPPSNVDSILIYSWFLSLLAGNKNIVRISSKKSIQLESLLNILDEILKSKSWEKIAYRNKLISYGYDEEINTYLSSISDMRVIWGGDVTVDKFRTYKTKPHSTELAFPDKRSISVIDSKKYLESPTSFKSKIIKGFINDTYWFNQMACSSPRMVFWYGKKDLSKNVSEAFWGDVSKSLLNINQEISFADRMNKYVAADRVAIEFDKSKITEYNPLLTLVNLDDFNFRNDLMPGSGFFYESYIENLEEFLPIIDRRIQTVSYFGIDKSKWIDFISEFSPKGIDRIVPIGQSLDFNTTWDGVDLLLAFTREVKVT